MNDVLERIADLEHIEEVSQEHGIVKVERWAMAELAEMKVALKRMEKAPVGAGARI